MRRISLFKILLASAAAGALAGLAACDDNPEDQSSDRLYLDRHAGNGQTERVGSQLPAPLVVRVRTLLDDPRSGVTVTFSSSDPGSHVSPPTAVTDANGLASCAFQLGSNAGSQYVRAAIEDDTTSFIATARDILCPEEDPLKVCPWPVGHIFVATTGSTLLEGAGSVVLDVDPDAGTFVEVLQTTELIDGISFSSRGELFITKSNEICKIDFSSHTAQTFFSGISTGWLLEPNPGGILAGLSHFGALRIGCTLEDTQYLIDTHIYPNLDFDCLAVDPVTRDLFLVTVASPIQCTLWRFEWDGQTTPGAHHTVANLQVGASDPAGMCVDSTGAVYIVFDSNDNYRRIVKVSSDGSIDYDFFDFYAHAGGNADEAGRWGDVAYLKGKLYLVDKRNDRLVTISRNGVWLGEIKDTAFSRPLDESEHYSIAASLPVLCARAAEPEARGPSRR